MCECLVPAALMVCAFMVGSAVGAFVGEWAADKVRQRKILKLAKKHAAELDNQQ